MTTVVHVARYTPGTVTLPRWDAVLPVALEIEARTQWFPVRAMCRVLGVDEDRQVAVVKERFPDALREVPMRIPDVGWRNPLCIRRKEMALWVGRINPKKCALTARGPLEEFQRDLLDAADRLFWKPAANVPPERRTVVSYTTWGEVHMACLDCGAPHLVIMENGQATVMRVRNDD